MTRLRRSFFARPTLTVARELLGQRLIKVEGRRRLAAIITEVEAYIGESDLACHARAGRTARTEVMYGPPGHLYVYFTYGKHWMLNFVTEREGFPAAVLLRKEAGIEKGSPTSNRQKVGKVTRAQLRKIAEIKMPDLNANDVDAAMNMIAGTARSMGIEVAD